MMILMVSNSARNESSVVNDPAPAISGNAIGTMEAPEGESCLKISTPKIISNAIMKRTIEPAIANEDISTPNKPNRASPTNKNDINIIKATDVAWNAFTGPLFFCRLRMIGIDPKISITAKSTIKADTISTNLISILTVFPAKLI